MKHQNNGNCAYCKEVMNRYPGIHYGLWGWFVKMQDRYPELHTSCAGRGRQDQEQAFIKGASKAQFGESAHNYNAALDLFFMVKDSKGEWDTYNKKKFMEVVKPNIPGWIVWYGNPSAKFYELPHVELKDWNTYDLQIIE